MTDKKNVNSTIEEGYKKKANLEIRKKIDAFSIKYFKILVVSFTLLILMLSLIFFLYPKYKAITEKIETINHKRVFEYTEKLLQLKDLYNLAAAYNSLGEENLDRINKMVPMKGESENLLAYFENLAKKNGILLSSISMETAPDKSNVSFNQKTGGLPAQVGSIKYKLDIALVDYVGLKRLLTSLENNLRLMDVTNLSFDPKKKSATLEITIYYIN